VFPDALRAKIGDEEVVPNKGIYMAPGLRRDGSRDVRGSGSSRPKARSSGRAWSIT